MNEYMKTWDLKVFIPTKTRFVAEYLGLPICLPILTVSGYLVFHRQNFDDMSQSIIE